MGKMLGKGSFARVHLATNKHTKEEFAIKSIDKKKLKESRRNTVRFIL